MTVSDEESVLSSDDLHTERDHWDSILYLIDMIDVSGHSQALITITFTIAFVKTLLSHILLMCAAGCCLTPQQG